MSDAAVVVTVQNARGRSMSVTLQVTSTEGGWMAHEVEDSDLSGLALEALSPMAMTDVTIITKAWQYRYVPPLSPPNRLFAFVRWCVRLWLERGQR